MESGTQRQEKHEVKIVPLIDEGSIVSKEEAHGLKSGYVILMPGKAMHLHTTGEKEEILVILEGTASVFYNGYTRVVRSNTCVYFPMNTEHSVTNIGDSFLRYVYVVTT